MLVDVRQTLSDEADMTELEHANPKHRAPVAEKNGKNVPRNSGNQRRCQAQNIRFHN